MSNIKNPIYARGETLWFRVNHNGQEIRRSTGFKVGQEDLAYQMMVETKKELEDEADGIVSHKLILDGMIKWLEDYVPHLSQPQIYQSHCRSIRPYIENVPMAGIYKVAADMKMDMLNKGLKPATINRRLSVLKRIATLAYSEWMWLKESPYKRIISLSENNERHIALTREEVQRIADACECEVTKNLVLFAAYTGLRTGEIFRLTAFSLKENVLSVLGKGHRVRHLPLHKSEVDFVKKYIPLQLSEGYLKRNFRGAADSVGLGHVKFHDLRHTFGTWLAKENKPLNKIMSLMGHTTVTMAQRYINMCVEDMRDDMPVLSKPEAPEVPVLKLVNLHNTENE